MRAAKHPRDVKCQICGKTFQTVYPKAKYCPYCQVYAQSVEKAALYRRYMTEGRKCLYCGKHFMPEVPDQRYCSDRCETKRKTNVAKCNDRHKKQVPVLQPAKPTSRPKYKSPISDKEQGALNVEVRKRISPTFDPGRKLTKQEIESIKHEITPIERIGHRCAPGYTFGASFGGER